MVGRLTPEQSTTARPTFASYSLWRKVWERAFVESVSPYLTIIFAAIKGDYKNVRPSLAVARNLFVWECEAAFFFIQAM